MTRRSLVFLFLLGLAVPLAIAQFQSLPGYMDADYYFGGGIQLAKGDGFHEPYLWNYLADPHGLPTPSHAYWMPLASIVSALGMWLTGQTTFASARLGFLLLAALVPPLTSLLAFRLTSNRASSLLSGLLACFPIYYAPFLPVTDNYGIYMLLGISFFLLLSFLLQNESSAGTAKSRNESSARTAKSPDFAPKSGDFGLRVARLPTNYQLSITFFLLGLLSALASLARSDGLLWLGLSLLAAVWHAGKQVHRYTGTQVDTEHLSPSRVTTKLPNYATSTFIFHLSSFIFPLLLGFLLLASPWYARNLQTFGSLMAPGGTRALWLTNYNDTFAYPASQLTFDFWLASGWDAILQARLAALQLNLLNAFAAQGGIFLFPFILIGLWIFRKDARIRFAVLAWILLLAAMTLVFPFAGPRGAFFHAGAALQSIWWCLAPVGLDATVAFARRRGWFDDRAFVIFRGALVGIAILMTAVVFVIRVLPGWEREDGHYAKVESLLVQQGAPTDAIIIVRNPPGYNIVTDRQAIALPTGGVPSILAVAARYHARYLVLEPEGTSDALRALYDAPDSNPSFRYLGETDGNRLYEILR